MKLTQLRGGLFPRYKLFCDYDYKFQHQGHLCVFTIPAGFEYDGATMGSFLFWRKSIHTSPHTAAHDYGYYKLGKISARQVGQDDVFSLKKSDIDRMFLEGIRQEVNVQDWRAAIASGVIKTIGWVPWLLRRAGILK